MTLEGHKANATAREIAAQDKSTKIDHAWGVLFGAALCMICGQPAVVLFTFGTFSTEIANATGWSRVELASAIAPAIIVAALLAPFVGKLADKVGARLLVIIGGPAFALGFVLMGYLSVSVFSFIALLTLTCALGFATTPLLYAHFASGWFARRRGLALSLVFASSSLGVMFWSPYAIKLINLYGWRTAYVAMGLTAGAIIFLSAIIFLRDPPRARTVDAAGNASGLMLSEAVRGATFWKILAIFGLITTALAGTVINIPVFLRQINVSGENAALVVSLAGLAMLVGRFAGGIMLDRWFAPGVAAISVAFPLIGFAVLSFDQSREAFIFAAIMLGFGLGAELDVASYIVSRAFGLRAFGAIYGMVVLSYGLASAIGPGAIGMALGLSVSPRLIFACLIVLLGAALLLLMTVRREHLPYDAVAASG